MATIILAIVIGLTAGDWINRVRFWHFSDTTEFAIVTVIDLVIIAVLSICMVYVKGA